MSKLSRSEAGRLGAVKTREVWRERYRQNPSYCGYCGEELPYEKRKNKFCNSSCAASHNNTGLDRRKTPRKLCVNCGSVISGNATKYCSMVCHREHEWQLRKQQIVKKGKENSHRVAKRYLTEERGHRCEICGISEWNGKDLPMILDHIDGNSENVSIANLRLVCSNCDSQLPTYKNRNVGNGRHKRRQRYKDGKSY